MDDRSTPRSTLIAGTCTTIAAVTPGRTRLPAIAWNAARDQRGLLPAIVWNGCPRSVECAFSFLPVRQGSKWFLLSELALAQFLNVRPAEIRKLRLGMSIADAVAQASPLGLDEVPAVRLLNPSMTIDDVLQRATAGDGPTLWLVVEQGREDHLAGVLSPFELM